MTFYPEMVEFVTEMLTEFGAASTITRYTDTYDKTKGRRTDQTSSSISVLAVVGPIAFKDEEGREVERTVATMNKKPKQGDKLTMGSRSWVLGEVTEINPAGTPICWFAEVAG